MDTNNVIHIQKITAISSASVACALNTSRSVYQSLVLIAQMQLSSQYCHWALLIYLNDFT